MNDIQNQQRSWKSRTRRTTVRLMIWTAVWTTSVGLSTFGPKFFWDYHTLYTALSIALALGAGYGMILAIKENLKSMDEMQQRIQLNAMGITLGAVLVVGVAYSTMDQTNLISGDADIGVLILFMSITYIISTIAGRIRYQ